MSGVQSRKRPSPATATSSSNTTGAPPPKLPNSARRALQIEVVTHLVATKLSPETLHTLRGTCTNWNRSFVSELRSRRHCYVKLSSHGQHSISTFTNLLRSKAVSAIPFTRYGLIDDKISPEAALDFFNVCGSSIRSLDLGAFSGLPIGATLRDFSSNLNKLRSLELHNPRPADLQVLTELARRPQKENPLCLTSFTCTATILSAQFGHGGGQPLRTFLEAQVGTLRELELKLIGAGVVTLPRILGLHALRIQKFGLRHVTVLYSNRTLAVNFPLLRELVLEDHTGPQPDEIVRTAWGNYLQASAHGRVTDLAIRGFNMGKLPVMDLQRLVLTSLTRLAIEMNSSARYGEPSAVWTAWPNLEELHISFRQGEADFPLVGRNRGEPDVLLPGGFELDEFLTGVPSTSFQALKTELGLAEALSLDKLRLMLATYKTRPGISDLTRLRKFTLEIRQAPNGSRLSDIGGYLGLAPGAPILRYVSIVTLMGPASLISAECIDLIRSVLGPFALVELQSEPAGASD